MQATAFACQMGRTYQMMPGQTETGMIPLTIQAVSGDMQPADLYTGPGAMVEPMGMFQAEFLGLYDQSGVARPGNATGPFQGNTWRGYTRWRPTGASMPGGSFVDVGVRASDGVIAGGSYPFCRILLVQAAPVTVHRWELIDKGVSRGVVQIQEPEDVRILRDGVMIYPASIFGGQGQWG